MLAKQVYHTATPYIISHQRYIIEKFIVFWDNQFDKPELVEQLDNLNLEVLCA